MLFRLAEDLRDAATNYSIDDRITVPNEDGAP